MIARCGTLERNTQWYDVREKNYRSCIRYQDAKNALFRHIKKTGHSIAWERVEFFEFDILQEDDRISFLLIHSYHNVANDGVMNPRY